MKRLLLLVVILALSVSMYGQRKLTLDEAISIALNKNYSLIKQKNNLKITAGNVDVATWNLLPSLDFSSSYAYAYSTKTSDYYGNVLSEARVTETNNYALGLNSSLTLFDGLSSWAKLSQSKDNLEAAKLSLERAKEDIVYNVTDYFYSIISYREQVNVNEENLKYNKKMLEQITEKNKLGSAALSDLYQWQYTVGNAELSLINAKNTLQKSIITLISYLSLDISETYELVDPSPSVLSSDITVDDSKALIDQAFRFRKDYQAQSFTLSSVKANKTTAWSRFLPQLGLTAGFGTDAIKADKLFNNRIWNARVNFNWNISFTDYFFGDKSIETAEINYQNAQEDLLNVERTIKSDVKQAVLDYQAAVKGYDVSEANLKAAVESKKISVEKYNLGSGTILDVLNTDGAYLQAAYNKISQQFQLYRTKDRLIKSLGRLDYQKYESK